MLSLSNMCKMRNKHLKQLKGKEGTAKKTLVEKKKIKFKPSATSIAKEQETEPSSIQSTGATMENQGGEGREGASSNTGESCGSRDMGSQTGARTDLGKLCDNASYHCHSWWAPVGVACWGAPLHPPPAAPFVAAQKSTLAYQLCKKRDHKEGEQDCLVLLCC